MSAPCRYPSTFVRVKYGFEPPFAWKRDWPHFANPNAVLGGWDVQDCNPAISNQPCLSVAGILKQLIVNYSTAFG